MAQRKDALRLVPNCEVIVRDMSVDCISRWDTFDIQATNLLHPLCHLYCFHLTMTDIYLINNREKRGGRKQFVIEK